MMNNLKKMICVLSVFAAVFAFASCEKNGNKNEQETTSVSQEESVTGVSVEAIEEALTVDKEKVDRFLAAIAETKVRDVPITEKDGKQVTNSQGVPQTKRIVTVERTKIDPSAQSKTKVIANLGTTPDEKNKSAKTEKTTKAAAGTTKSGGMKLVDGPATWGDEEPEQYVAGTTKAQSGTTKATTKAQAATTKAQATTKAPEKTTKVQQGTTKAPEKTTKAPEKTTASQGRANTEKGYGKVYRFGL